MNIAQIEENVKVLLNSIAAGDIEQSKFIYELLLAYGHRKQSITRLRSGERNLSAKGSTPRHDEITWKRNLYFKHIDGDELHAEIDQMRKEKRVATNKIRFVIVTNFNQLLAVDTKTSDTLDIQFDELPKQFDFFLPWAGMEKAVYQGENPADVKAAEKMAKLFDLIKDDNFDASNKDDIEALHNLNIFLTRLLFCFFAEDTEIFTDNQFSFGVESHTKNDGSDLSAYLNRLFTVLNTADSDRGELPDYLANFPYVNGGLFADDIPSPVFSAKSRRMLIECGSELDWSDINPDIFGSMIQAVVHPDQRGGMGMHYTSVTNIMKVIEPLFLNDLYEELEKVESSTTKLQKLQQRLGEIKIFDPACGSGNFLIIGYKELRKLEMEVLKRLQELNDEKQDLKSGVMAQIFQPFSVIKLSQFYGIELDDFAHEVAILSLWLAEHQMNVEFKAEFGDCSPSLPLQKGGSIVCGNATRISWEDVCPKSDDVFILGNPPYVGSRYQEQSHKHDIEYVCEGMKSYKKLDYIACWFFKAGDYLYGSKSRFAFVSTSSICQGEQVEIFWPRLIDQDYEVAFTHKPFMWSNNAKSNAAVTCIILGLQKKCDKPKRIFTDNFVLDAEHINAYLLDAPQVIVGRRTKTISDLPKMVSGNKATDGGHLILNSEEKNLLIDRFPGIAPMIRQIYGAEEFINGKVRWCLWLEDADLEYAVKDAEVYKRIENVRKVRLASNDSGAQKLAAKPHQFREMREPKNNSLIVPTVTSERRDYIPIGYLKKTDVVIAPNNVIYDPPPYLFGILSSRIHVQWVRVVAGRLKTDYRYSSALCYNNFPIPSISSKKEQEITGASLNIIQVRERYPDKTIGQIYDPDKMPRDLLEAHMELDRFVEACYRKTPFNNDSERLECLFSLYETMTGGQNA